MSDDRSEMGDAFARRPKRSWLRWNGGVELAFGGALLAGVLLVAQMRPGAGFTNIQTATARPVSSAIALPAELVAHLQRWRALPALHVRAEFALEVLGVQDHVDEDCVPLEVGEVAQGFVEFWGQDGRFRTISWVDVEALRGLRTQVAFDGTTFQMLLSDGTLSRSSVTVPPKTLLPAYSNPLFELVRFRYPLTDASTDLELSFEQIQQDPLPAVSESSGWRPARLNGSDVDVVDIPGGIQGGLEYDHRLYVMPGDRSSPVRVDCIARGGRLLNSTEFLEYASSDGTQAAVRWPRRIVTTGYDASGEPVVRMTWFILELDTPANLSQDVFVIPETLSLRVYDEQLGRCVR